MANRSVPPPSTRLQRGIRLYLERHEEIERRSAFVWSVPSCSSDETYLCYLDLPFCTCPDFPRAKSLNLKCKHLHAAFMAHQNRRELRAMAKREVAKSKRVLAENKTKRAKAERVGS